MLKLIIIINLFLILQATELESSKQSKCLDNGSAISGKFFAPKVPRSQNPRVDLGFFIKKAKTRIFVLFFPVKMKNRKTVKLMVS